MPAGLSQVLTCLRRWVAALLVLAVLGSHAQANGPEAQQAQLHRTTEALLLSARLRLQPGPAVEDALLKGVPLYFVWNADVYRHRWYWSDKRVASATRTLRLAYQPLTRRWRLSVASDGSGSSSAGLQYALHQNFDSLAQAMAAVGRVSRWKIADASRLDEDDTHRVEWGFRLDLSLLPRPFQIGMGNQPEWVMEMQRALRVPTQVEAERRTDPASDPGPDGAGDLSGTTADSDR
jgi:hypothetical protein